MTPLDYPPGLSEKCSFERETDAVSTDDSIAEEQTPLVRQIYHFKSRHQAIAYELCPPFRPASLAASLPFSKLPLLALPPCEAMSCCCSCQHETVEGKTTTRTTFSLGMLAKPEFSVPVWPPLDATFLTSSAERLAKFPGLSLPDIVFPLVCGWVGGVGRFESGDVFLLRMWQSRTWKSFDCREGLDYISPVA